MVHLMMHDNIVINEIVSSQIERAHSKDRCTDNSIRPFDVDRDLLIFGVFPFEIPAHAALCLPQAPRPTIRVALMCGKHECVENKSSSLVCEVDAVAAGCGRLTRSGDKEWNRGVI